jgi:hypothetical protein
MMLWTYRVFHDKEGYCIRVVYYERDGMLISYQKEHLSCLSSQWKN